jgi:hypothetical protein
MGLYFFDRIQDGETSRGEHGMEFATPTMRAATLYRPYRDCQGRTAEHSDGCQKQCRNPL